MRARGVLGAALTLAATAAAAAGCGGGDRGAGEARRGPPELEGTVRVVTSLERWSLLAVPRDGGTVQARSVTDPSRVLWEGDTALPPVGEIHLLDGPLLIVRTREGTVLRYDPRADELETVESVPSGSAWSAWDGYGVFRPPSGEGLVEIGPEGSWRYTPQATPLWAAPVESGRLAALVETEGERQIWLLARGSDEAEATASDDFRAPGLSMAWGRRLALAAERGLSILDVPSLSDAGRVELPGTPAVLAASPSSHELYAGIGDPSSIVRISRFTGRSERMTRLPRSPQAIRPAVLGDFLLVDDGGEPLLVPLDGSATERLAGGWRDDLPLGLPDGRVLLASEGSLRLHVPGSDSSATVDAPAGRWWGAVPWNPNPPRPVARSAPPETGPGAAAARDSAPGGPGGAPTARSDTAGAGPEVEEPPSGFYAVVTAARDPEGVRRLLASLRSAGYPTELQLHTDDAGRTWYRGLVGRYATREAAEAVARQLERERDLNAWITEIGSTGGGEEVLR